MHILATLLGLFKAYSYWVVFFGVMLENAGLPAPGETILLAAGFFASDGSFHLPQVMAIAALPWDDVLGAISCSALGNSSFSPNAGW